MALTLKPGTRLYSRVSAAEFIVVKAPPAAVDVVIAGHPAVTSAADRELTAGGAAPVEDAPAAMGKRYVDEGGTIELLCTKAGASVPVVDDVTLEMKDAKPLPSSD